MNTPRAMTQGRGSVEWHGFDPVPEDQRRGKPFGQFTMWFGSQMHMSALVLGAIGISMGLGLAGTIAAVIVGNILGGLGNSLCAMMGPRYGMPQLIHGRAAFGYKGNYLPAFLSTLLFLGYSTVAIILCAQAIKLMWPVPPVVLAAVVLGVICIFLAVYGYDWIHLINRWLSIASLVVFIILTALAANYGHHKGIAASLPFNAEYFKSWILEMSVAFSFAVSWAPYAADYSRYLPRAVSRGKVFWFSFAGLGIAASWVMSLGAILATLAVNGDALNAIKMVGGGFADIALTVLLIGQMISGILNMYSGGMSCLTWGVRAKRWIPVTIIGIIAIVLAIFIGGAGFVTFFKGFLFLIAYFVTPWIAIIGINFYWIYNPKRRHDLPSVAEYYRPSGLFAGVNRKAYIAFFAGIAVSVPFIATNMFTGPLGKALGGADISYFVSFVVAGVLYYGITVTRSRGRGADAVRTGTGGEFAEQMGT